MGYARACTEIEIMHRRITSSAFLLSKIRGTIQGACVGLALAACGDSSAPEPGPGQEARSESSSTVAAAVRTVDKGDGLTVDIQEEGTGEVASNGRWLKIHYRGRLSDGGTEFHSTFKSGAPYSLQLGAGSVIEGWERGLEGLRQGAKAVLHIPAALAYQGTGLPGMIPPDADLEFEVQVVEVR